MQIVREDEAIIEKIESEVRESVNHIIDRLRVFKELRTKYFDM